MCFVIFPWHTFIGKGKGKSCHDPPSLISIPYFFCSFTREIRPFFLTPPPPRKELFLPYELFFLKASLSLVVHNDLLQGFNPLFFISQIFQICLVYCRLDEGFSGWRIGHWMKLSFAEISLSLPAFASCY